jgi:glycerol uptake facilitator-like aquaporin
LRGYGYIARFSNWALGWIVAHKISEKWSLPLAFVGAAIASGIIGNLSYDVIKVVVKKVYKPE